MLRWIDSIFGDCTVDMSHSYIVSCDCSIVRVASHPGWHRKRDREVWKKVHVIAACIGTISHVYQFSLRFGLGLLIKQIYMWRWPKCSLMLISQSCICKGNKTRFKETKRKKMEWLRGGGSSTSMHCCYASKQNRPLALVPYMMLSFLKHNRDSLQC